MTKMIKSHDKTYIFRKYFGFDLLSLIYHLRKIYESQWFPYICYGEQSDRMCITINNWIDFYTRWLCNDKNIEETFLEFIEDSYEHLKDIYDISTDILRDQLDKALRTNTREHVKEEFALGVVRRSFSD